MAELLQTNLDELRKKTLYCTGQMPGKYLRSERLKMAAELLTRSQQPLKKIAYQCGYCSYAAFCRRFSRWSGMPPSQYRIKGTTRTLASPFKWSMPPTDDTQTDLSVHLELYPWLRQLFRCMLNRLSEETLSLADLAEQVHLSPSQLTKKLKSTISSTSMRLLYDLRLLHAAWLLGDTSLSVSEIAIDAGFFDQPHFTRSFRLKFGCTPSEYRNRKNTNHFCNWLRTHLKA